ncbi:hypothetical protein O0I10_011662 [Lichtheimia ornata]|uniref:F-box domain-containing protein n=1 Tax=Lichtheimia ornata TaxID=688661 RepID=A0AAD7XWJ9_9FUNG|nr:uncharacterized protein O0I10_011662 [Lichtheimia ornata]KAJ8652717.1 hypothetical protein O0I10_011662 [Lichtheimia ornata]
MATIEDISWTELLKNTIVTAQHGNGSNRIATATETLQQTAQRFVEVLNERARLLANSAQFDTALRDAAAIRAIFPGSGLGYLCNGDIYGQQGHYDAAISIYDQGLEAVPVSDPCYQQLQQHRMTAVSSNNKRVDFISRLPLDIVVTNILPRVDHLYCSNTPCEFLYISRAWQERILRQPNGLRFNFGYRWVRSLEKDHTQLIRFAPYVQSLQGGITDARLGDLFSRARFSNLKKLDIKCDPTTPRLPFIHGLRLIADSLTHLTISDCPGLQLRDILETCPNLVFLKATNVDAVMPLSSPSSYPNLKYLSLDRQVQRTLEHEDVMDVLKRLPSLRMMEISPMPDTTCLTILHKHCPYLQFISFESWIPDYGLLTANVDPNRKGVISAYFNGDRFYYQDDLIEFLYAQRNSLEIFRFGGVHEIENAFWELSDDGRVKPHSPSEHLKVDLSSPFSFTRLKHLSFTDMFPYKNVPMILWIVLNAPKLNAIEIPNSHFKPEVAKALNKLKHIRKVEISHNDVHDMDDNIIDDDYEGIHLFLEHHAALGDQSTLEHVIVQMDFVDASEQTWLSLLPQLRCLKVLEIRGEGATGDCTLAKNCTPIIERIHRESPALEKLIINRKCRVGRRSHRVFAS